MGFLTICYWLKDEDVLKNFGINQPFLSTKHFSDIIKESLAKNNLEFRHHASVVRHSEYDTCEKF